MMGKIKKIKHGTIQSVSVIQNFHMTLFGYLKMSLCSKTNIAVVRCTSRISHVGHFILITKNRLSCLFSYFFQVVTIFWPGLFFSSSTGDGGDECDISRNTVASEDTSKQDQTCAGHGLLLSNLRQLLQPLLVSEATHWLWM